MLTPLAKGSEESINNLKATFIKSIKDSKNILVLVSPTLSCEELTSAQQLAVKSKAIISGYAPQYFDEAFKDDMLRTNDKSANRAAFVEININEDENAFNESLKKASLVIILENSYFDDKTDLLKGKKVINCTSHQSPVNEFANAAIPVASFLEKSGTYINCDGIKQEVVSKINKDKPSVDLKAFLDAINSML